MRVSLIVGNEKRETVEEGKAGERMEVGREEGKRSARREKCSSSLFLLSLLRFSVYPRFFRRRSYPDELRRLDGEKEARRLLFFSSLLLFVSTSFVRKVDSWGFGL